jgi:hypothetical protein
MNGRHNPFAAARGARIRARADRLKAELNARHDAPGDFLSDSAQPLPAGTKTPEALVYYENYIPIAVRRAALRANHKARSFQNQNRKHRTTGRSRGPKVDDTDLARHVHRLIQDGLDRLEAQRELAAALARAEIIDPKSAQTRVRKALRKLG